MPEHQPRFAGRGPAVLAFHDFRIGAAYADGNRLHEDRSFTLVRLGYLLEARRPRLERFYGYGLHLDPLPLVTFALSAPFTRILTAPYEPRLASKNRCRITFSASRCVVDDLESY